YLPHHLEGHTHQHGLILARDEHALGLQLQLQVLHWHVRRQIGLDLLGQVVLGEEQLQRQHFHERHPRGSIAATHRYHTTLPFTRSTCTSPGRFPSSAVR